MKTRTTLSVPLIAALVLVVTSALVGAPAFAQARGYAINRLEPAEPGSDWYLTESLDFRGALRPQIGAMVDWAYRPLVAEDRSGRETEVVVDQIFVHTRADLVLADLLRVGLSLPIAVYQHGDDPQASIAARSPRRDQSLGDVRLTSDLRVFGTFESSIRAAIGVQLFLPTGTRAAYTGDGTVRVAPRFLVAGAIAAFDWAVRAGVHLRPFDGTWEGRSLGHEVSLAASAGVKVNDRFVLGPEIQAVTAVSGDAFSRRGTPLDFLLGGRVRLANDFQVGTAIGGGLVAADGSPKMRVLAIFEYAPDVCVDKDGDGICAYADACPEVDGVRTNDRRTNGCPADRDQDGIPDRNDACPDEGGMPSSEPFRNGCPPSATPEPDPLPED